MLFSAATWFNNVLTIVHGLPEVFRNSRPGSRALEPVKTGPVSFNSTIAILEAIDELSKAFGA